MALRGKQPEKIEKRLKAFFYGGAGVGKTMCSIQFPKPYLIDTEKGSQNTEYVDILKKNGGAVFETSSFDDVVEEVFELLKTKHDYKTLIIDPLTIVYTALIEKAELSEGTKFGKHYGVANKSMRRLINLLLRLDMNVIITAHAKEKYSDNMQVIGYTYDCYKKLDHLFDLVLEVHRNEVSRYAVVKKTRIKQFKEFETFDFDYKVIAKKCGYDALEKECVPEILASKKDVDSVNDYIKLLGLSEKYIEACFSKLGVASCYEISKNDIDKLIEHFKIKLEKTKEKDGYEI